MCEQNKKQYIEREKLKENLESYIGVWLDTHTAEVNEAVDKGIELALRIVKRQPAADVVEVVRCKDCKYGEKDTETDDLWYLCKYDGCAWNYGNHYCGYGKRRASDE